MFSLKFDGSAVTAPSRLNLDVGNYSIISLAAEIEMAFDVSLPLAGHPEFSVTVTPYVDNNTLLIKAEQDGGGIPTWQFKILTDKELEQFSRFVKPYQTVNSVLNNQQTTLASSIEMGPIDLHQVRNLYIHSPNLATYTTLSLSGARDIIKKVPVNAKYNELIFNNVMVAQDYLDCSRQTLSRLSFRLEDVFGNPIDLHGNRWSFSLIFAKFDTEL